MMETQGDGNKVARGIPHDQQKQQYISYSKPGNGNEQMIPY
jgi:hypothetical protein